MVGRGALSYESTTWQLLSGKFAACSGLPAIETGSARLTYGDLSDLVDQQHALLRKSGVRSGEVIAVRGHLGLFAIVSTLAVWAADCILVLVDESLPAERQEVMLREARVHWTVQLDESSQLTVQRIAPDVARIWPSDRDYAYVAFTSGSTGIPKAIVGSHQGLQHFLQWQVEEFALTSEDRFAHLTNISFDVWFRDALTPLVAGACLCIPDHLDRSADSLLSYLRDGRITAIHLVPSVAEMWLTATSGMDPMSTLAHTFFAGEPLYGSLVQRWRHRFPNCTIVNFYGPSETTLAQFYWRVSNPPLEGIQPVGDPIPQSHALVLDESGAEAGPGGVGEIHIHASRPGHGYLTNGSVEPFVSLKPLDGRMITYYASGDLGMTDASGMLHVVGRLDDQVKISGVRVELQEVRLAIRSMPNVEDAFVCAVDLPGGRVLAASVQTSAPDEVGLRSHLRTRLIAATIPSVVLFVEDFPKLPNGKIDRSTLRTQLGAYVAARRVIDSSDRVSDSSRTVPERLARIWSEFVSLDVHEVQRSSGSFFDLGGSSLSIVGLHARMQETFSVKFSLVLLFESFDFASQVRLIDRLLGGDVGESGSMLKGSQEERRRTAAARRARNSQN